MSGKKAAITRYVSPRNSPEGQIKNKIEAIDKKKGADKKVLPKENKTKPKAQTSNEDVERPSYMGCVDRLYSKMHERDAKVLAQRQSVDIDNIETC